MKRPAGVARLLVFEAGFLAAYTWGMIWARGVGAALWPSDAVLLAALLLDDPKRWWWYLLGALPIRLLMPPPSPDWLLWALYLNDSLKALLSASLLRRLLQDPPSLRTPRDFIVLVLVAGVLSPALSALGGATAYVGLGSSFWPVWSRWFLGDSLAIVVLVPTILFVAQRRFAAPFPPMREICALSIALVAVSWFAFSRAAGATAYTPVLVYAPVSLLIWAIFRTGAAGGSLALTVVALLAMAGADRGRGPFAAYGEALNLIAVQLFLLLLAAPMTMLALVIEALSQSRAELRVQNDRLRALTGQLITAQDDERSRLSRELHDDIAQRLALISVELGIVESNHRAAHMWDNIMTIRKEIDDVSVDIHNLSRGMHASNVRQLGLPEALRSWCTQMAAKHRLTIDLTDSAAGNLSTDASVCLYRVAQEALSNAVRHGRPRRVTVELRQRNGTVRLRVADSGCGFDLSAPTNGMGLVAMQERVRYVGGNLTVLSTPGRGTEVLAEIPGGTSHA